MKSIRCHKCLFGFRGDIVCMACATGYALDYGECRPSIGQRVRLVQVFRLESRRGFSGRICETMITDRVPTDACVTIVGDGKFIEIDGVQHEGLHVPTAEISCPRCLEQQLKFDLARPDRCPHCGRLQLYAGGLL